MWSFHCFSLSQKRHGDWKLSFYLNTPNSGIVIFKTLPILIASPQVQNSSKNPDNFILTSDTRFSIEIKFQNKGNYQKTISIIIPFWSLKASNALYQSTGNCIPGCYSQNQIGNNWSFSCGPFGNFLGISTVSCVSLPTNYKFHSVISGSDTY